MKRFSILIPVFAFVAILSPFSLATPVAKTVTVPGPSVKTKQAPTVLRMGTTATGGTLTIARVSVNINPDNSTAVFISYTDAGGFQVHTRGLLVDGACTQVKDSYGTVVANPAPSALCTAISSFTAQLDTLIANGAAAGKLNL